VVTESFNGVQLIFVFHSCLKNNHVILANFRKSECVFVFKELIGMVAGRQTGCMVERAFRNKIFLAKYNKIQ